MSLSTASETSVGECAVDPITWIHLLFRELRRKKKNPKPSQRSHTIHENSFMQLFMQAVCYFAVFISQRKTTDEKITKKDFLNLFSRFLNSDDRPRHARGVAAYLLRSVNLNINTGMDDYMEKLIGIHCDEEHVGIFQASLWL